MLLKDVRLTTLLMTLQDCHNNLKTIFHTIRGDRENNWGLKLKVEENLIHQVCLEGGIEEEDTCWVMDDFKSRLIKKHNYIMCQRKCK